MELDRRLFRYVAVSRPRWYAQPSRNGEEQVHVCYDRFSQDFDIPPRKRRIDIVLFDGPAVDRAEIRLIRGCYWLSVDGYQVFPYFSFLRWLEDKAEWKDGKGVVYLQVEL